MVLLRAAVILLALLRFLGAPEACSAQSRAVAADQETVQLRLSEMLRIGSPEGPEALGRVMSGALDGAGRILVADDLNDRISVFAPDGRLVRHVGRTGSGPGEFEQPWIIVADEADSVFVWDQASSRISVFGPDLVFARSFSLPPGWIPSSLKFLPSGDLLVAATGVEDHGLHVLDRTGTVRRSLEPRSLRDAGHRESEPLLAGHADLVDGEIGYASSPAGIVFYDAEGHVRATCPPDAHAEARATGDGRPMETSRFMHSAAMTALGNGLYLHLKRDPVRNTRVLELLRSDCVLLRKSELNLPLTFVARREDRLLAVRTLDFTEVVVYRFEVLAPPQPPSNEHHQEVNP